MFESIKRKKGRWLKNIIFGAVAGSFLIGFLLLPGIRDSFTRGKKEIVASVGGNEIYLKQYQKVYKNAIEQYKNIFKDQFSEDMIKQLNLKEQILNSLIDNLLMMEEAKRLRFKVSDEELRESIREYPAFKDENGNFNRDLYIRVLRYNKATPSDFETSQRQALLVEKLQNFIYDSVQVTEQEVFEDYKIKNEKVNLDYLIIDPKEFEKDVKVDDKEMEGYYSKNQKEFYTPLKRAVNYLVFNPNDVQNKIDVPDKDIEKYYKENEEKYKTPPQIKARHILIKVEPDSEAEIKNKARTKAEEILVRVKNGEDFEALAKEFSDDPGSKEKGGDLGYFSKKRMVKQFEDVAFSLGIGEVSDVVETTYGYHIIKVEDIREEGIKPVDEVKSQIINTLKREKSEEYLEEFVDKAKDLLNDNKDIDFIAKELELNIDQKEISEGEERIPGIMDSEIFLEKTFSTNKGELSDIFKGSRNYYLLKVNDIVEPKLRGFDEVKDELKNKLISEKGKEMAKLRAQEIFKGVSEDNALERMANKYNLKIEETGLFNRRGDYIPKIGSSEEISKIAFKLTKDNPYQSEPILYNEKFYLIVLKEKEDIDSEKFKNEEEELIKQLLERKRQEALQNYIKALRDRTKIKKNYALI